MKRLLILIFTAGTYLCPAQQAFYDITAGNGNGIRFWEQDDSYKIHMGSGPEYFYGPVTDYSIKTNMSGGFPARGWTWGVAGQVPVAAINIQGNMQIAGGFTVGGDIVLPSFNGNKQIYTWYSGDANWRIGMSPSPGFSTSMATSHVQYVSYFNAPGQGFAVGVNGGQSSFEITGSNHNAFFRGNIGIGVPIPQEALHLNGGIRGNISGALRINSGNGYIDVGAQNPSWAHIYTDRPNFIFNQGVYSIPGVFSSYSNADLTLATGSTNRLSISNATGNVGIGTINAPEKLTVTGNIQVPLSNAMGYLVSTDKLTHNGNSVGNYSLGWFWDSWQTGAPTGYLSSAGGLKFFTGSTLRMAIDAFGNMGIGTGSAALDAKLDVKGQVHAQEVKIDLSVPGPDYVFEKDYQLTSLEEIKNYVDQNKHLPEVPSAKEMEKNGVLLGEMNMLLLRKIEELTLHLIEQNKFIEQLKEERRVSPDDSGKKIEELTLYVIELKNRDEAQQKEIEILKGAKK